MGIYMSSYSAGTEAWCSGVLVQEDAVLTAAACLDGGYQPIETKILYGECLRGGLKARQADRQTDRQNFSFTAAATEGEQASKKQGVLD